MDSEEALVRRLEWYFRVLGYVIAKEVPVGVRSVDLYCVDANTGTTVAVEAKLHDWRGALRQARVYRLAADFTYIALPERAMTAGCLDACSEEGIGAISMPKRGRARLVLAAVPHGRQRRVLVHKALSVVGPKLGAASLYA